MRRQQHDQQSRVFCHLSALVYNLIRPPPQSPSRPSPPPQITPAGFASLLLGIAVSLMLCGSVTFFIGFMLMPWVLVLLTVFYVAGVLSSLALLGRSILCYATPRKDLPGFAKYNNLVCWVKQNNLYHAFTVRYCCRERVVERSTPALKTA